MTLSLPNQGKKTKTFSYLIDPFDIMLPPKKQGLFALQSKFSSWLQAQSDPVRLITWHVPPQFAKTNQMGRAPCP